MTKFVGKIEFGANITSADAQGWLEAVQKQLPEGAYITLKQEPLILDVTELNETHYGEKIKVYVHGFGEVSGKLEAVFKAGRKTDDTARTLVIDGRAWTVSHGVAQLSEW